MYREAFEPLADRALLNHLLERAEFDALLGDDRVHKLIARHGSEPVGLAMITNALELVPQISPPFLHAHYPEQSARQAVYFAIIMFVGEQHRRSTAFARLVAGMGQITAENSGVAVFDICRHNLSSMELDQQVATIARWFPGASVDKIDEQSYFAATVPSMPTRHVAVSSPSTAPTPTVHIDEHADVDEAEPIVNVA